jgi:hypothetical protein
MAKSYHRKHEYLAGDFITEAVPRAVEKVEDVVDKKINLLYDFYILKRNKREADPREYFVRKYLTELGKQYSSVLNAEYAMTAALHNILRGDKTLEQMLNGR